MSDKKVPTWNDLLKFIEAKVKENPDFLSHEIFIECVDEKNCPESSGWVKVKDHEDWSYVRPAWILTQADGGQCKILTTTFKDKKITTLNINY